MLRRLIVLSLVLAISARTAFSFRLVPYIASSKSIGDATFVSGIIPNDTDGQPIHAHEGCILELEGVFLWYGTSQKQQQPANGDSQRATDQQPTWLSDGVNLYTSRDLSSWRKKGMVLHADSITGVSEPGPYRIERPKVIYDSTRRYYVLLFHLDTANYSLSSVGVAVAVSPYGPFVFQHSFQPDGLSSRDMTVAMDDNGTAYLVRSVADSTTAISTLTTDFLGTSGICSRAPAAQAYAVFKHEGKWYILGSQVSGWSPAPLLLFTTDSTSLCGAEWRLLPSPASGQGSKTGFGSQPAFIYTHHFSDNQVLHIYFGDRWNLDGPGSIGNASYVWLPLLPHATTPGAFDLQWHDSWSITDFQPAAPSRR
eukprot:jgi/Chrzof1/2859/Cz12g01150.t1